MGVLFIQPHRFGGGWTPSDLANGLEWWDGGDVASHTYSSGSLLSAWAGQMGAYTLSQGTSTKQPSASGSLNGRTTVVFDGSSDAMSVASFNMGTGQKWSFWAIFTAASGGVQVVAEQSADYNSNAGAWVAYRNSSNYAVSARNGPTEARTNATLTTTAKLFVASYDGTLSTDELALRLNGTAGQTYSFNGNTSGSNRNDTLYVGARNTSSLYLNGSIAAFGVTLGVMSTADAEALEAWGTSVWATP